MIAAALFLVTLQPATGIGGGSIKVEIEAHDSDKARKMATAQYKGSYRVIDVRRVSR